MQDFTSAKTKLDNEGFSIIGSIFTKDEVGEIIKAIDNTNASNDKFRKTADLFAIRQFLKEVPIGHLIFNEKLKLVVRSLFGNNYFVVKSIYFDKPELSNWFVAFHQDLTISVDKKIEIENFGPWTTKQDQFAVQPPLEILQNIFTVRIHLDDTDENNGALKVIPKSHLDGICRVEKLAKSNSDEVCKVEAGGIMIMKPLLFHSSSRSTSNKKRRVIHLEFSDVTLPQELHWSEKMDFLY
jgi:ectoine hydroxylase-related dioxygenase (phytanoyl-CoA dioxygenase family)